MLIESILPFGANMLARGTASIDSHRRLLMNYRDLFDASLNTSSGIGEETSSQFPRTRGRNTAQENCSLKLVGATQSNVFPTGSGGSNLTMLGSSSQQNNEYLHDVVDKVVHPGFMQMMDSLDMFIGDYQAFSPKQVIVAETMIGERLLQDWEAEQERARLRALRRAASPQTGSADSPLSLHVAATSHSAEFNVLVQDLWAYSSSKLIAEAIENWLPTHPRVKAACYAAIELHEDTTWLPYQRSTIRADAQAIIEARETTLAGADHGDHHAAKGRASVVATTEAAYTKYTKLHEKERDKWMSIAFAAARRTMVRHCVRYQPVGTGEQDRNSRVQLAVDAALAAYIQQAEYDAPGMRFSAIQAVLPAPSTTPNEAAGTANAVLQPMAGRMLPNGQHEDQVEVAPIDDGWVNAVTSTFAVVGATIALGLAAAVFRAMVPSMVVPMELEEEDKESLL